MLLTWSGRRRKRFGDVGIGCTTGLAGLFRLHVGSGVYSDGGQYDDDELGRQNQNSNRENDGGEVASSSVECKGSSIPERGGDLLVFLGDFDGPLADASILEVPMMTMMYYIIKCEGGGMWEADGRVGWGEVLSGKPRMRSEAEEP